MHGFASHYFYLFPFCKEGIYQIGQPTQIVFYVFLNTCIRVVMHSFNARARMHARIHALTHSLTHARAHARTHILAHLSPMHLQTWRKRLEIIVAIARGLVYLHSMKPAMVHRDVKSQNILLTASE
jgi:hypothetical protein